MSLAQLGRGGEACLKRVMSAEVAETTQRAIPKTRDFSLLYDIPLSITVEIARSNVSVRELLEAKAEFVLTSPRLVGSPVDICLNGRQIARGEIVALGEKAGVRIIEILKPGSDHRIVGRMTSLLS